jgi:hypothetical protein
MGLNTSTTRSDIPYLRRRVKSITQSPVRDAAPAVPGGDEPTGLVLGPGAHPIRPAQKREKPVEAAPPPAGPSAGLTLGAPAAAPAAPAPSTGLSLGTPAAPSTGLSLGSPAAPSAGLTLGAPSPTAASVARRPAAPARPQPFPAPTIDEVRELGDEDPVLRLNARESAVGSLIVTGAATVVWEDWDGVTGSATSDGGTSGTPVKTSGNRPLVGYDESDAVVTLRHVRELRRALFIGRGGAPLGAQIFDGSTFTVAPGDGNRTFVLYLLRIDSLVELRAAPVDRGATDATLLRQFGFALTPFLETRESRSR